jgi:hypothetical protein
MASVISPNLPCGKRYVSFIGFGIFVLILSVQMLRGRGVPAAAA